MEFQVLALTKDATGILSLSVDLQIILYSVEKVDDLGTVSRLTDDF